MSRRWLARWLVALLLVVAPVGRLGPAVPVAAQGAVAPAAPSAAVRDALQTVEAELSLLLGRYATPLDVATLLAAGWRGAQEAGPAQAPGSEPPAAGAAGTGTATGPGDGAPFAADRRRAWADFGARFASLADAPGADPDELARGANRAMARSVGDCHTAFATSHERETQSFEGGGRYGGVGASVAGAETFDPRPPGPLVVQVTEGGPAQRAGVRAGDAVLAVDDVDTGTLSPSRLVELVRGEPGTAVRLRLDRPGAAGTLEVTVERALLDINPVVGRLVTVAVPAGGVPGTAVAVPGEGPALGGVAGPSVLVGYVALREFSRASEAALPAALDELRAGGATHWVLDLRGNRGGNLTTFTRLASLFIPEGTLAVTVDRSGAESSISADAGTYRPYLQPLAVLVDGQSASAAELLAADLQEYGVARVFGATTAGCFGTSRLFRLPDGSALWLTVSALQSGLARRDVHRTGLSPDEPVLRTRLDLAAGVDGPLARALAWVAGAAGTVATGARDEAR